MPHKRVEPSGEFHIGNALNWIYFDFIARFKRMQGFNVLFPQGWDCHGLPTEVQVEKDYGIRKGDVPREKFRSLCLNTTKENIEKMRQEMNSLGLSIDWSTEYRTMDPDYLKKTQLSFLQLYKRGLIYRGDHPVNWCPRCETAIADAEVEYENRKGDLNYIRFPIKGEDDYLPIATTRPELLPACVLAAVHPTDERYKEYIGKDLEVPLFGQTVKVVEDREVDPDFGSGAVMVCTYGDKADVRWIERYGLPVISCLDEQGNLTQAAKDYVGLSVEEAREEMIKDLDSEGLLDEREPLDQKVGVCWRCKTPVEILSKDQWFMRVMDLNNEVIKKAKELQWIPEHMKLRLINWARSMDWDWVISRQRIFASPIPVWYCSRCNEPILANEEQLPVNSIEDEPPIDECQKCGSEEFKPEEDVLDTWMDSSITAAVHAGWPNIDHRLFPADLQPNGTDIIRTWDYYLLVRHLALLGEAPFKTLLINGMVLGQDGQKMSKSQGNYVETTAARDRHGADALRQWAAATSPGSDVQFGWKEIDFGYRFLRKLWNAARFAAPHVTEIDPEVDLANLDLWPADRWILSRLNCLVMETTDLMEEFQFNLALRKIRTFVWHEFCDQYIEEVKYRLYGEEGLNVQAAKLTLHLVLWTIVRLLAPFIPHFCEEIYHSYFSDKYFWNSIHQANWPKTDKRFINEEAEKTGDFLNTIIGAIRQFKSDRGVPLSREISTMEIYARDQEGASEVERISSDIKGTVKVKNLEIEVGAPEVEERVVSIEPSMSKLGPKLRDNFESIASVLKGEDPQNLVDRLAKGRITVRVGEKEYEISSKDLKISKKIMKEGKEAEIVDIPEFNLVILLSI